MVTTGAADAGTINPNKTTAPTPNNPGEKPVHFIPRPLFLVRPITAGNRMFLVAVNVAKSWVHNVGSSFVGKLGESLRPRHKKRLPASGLGARVTPIPK
jgi:hypothetical protein